jgi:hypothetical protein
LRVKLQVQGIHHYFESVSRYVVVDDINLPEAMRSVARECYPSDGDLRRARESSSSDARSASLRRERHRRLEPLPMRSFGSRRNGTSCRRLRRSRSVTTRKWQAARRCSARSFLSRASRARAQAKSSPHLGHAVSEVVRFSRDAIGTRRSRARPPCTNNSANPSSEFAGATAGLCAVTKLHDATALRIFRASLTLDDITRSPPKDWSVTSRRLPRLG